MKKVLLLGLLWSAPLLASSVESQSIESYLQPVTIESATLDPFTDGELGKVVVHKIKDKYSGAVVTFPMHVNIPFQWDEMSPCWWFNEVTRELFLRNKYADFFLNAHKTEISQLEELRKTLSTAAGQAKTEFETQRLSLLAQFETHMKKRWQKVLLSLEELRPFEDLKQEDTVPQAQASTDQSSGKSESEH